jgi:hypothetical protein
MTGGHFLVCHSFSFFALEIILSTETTAEHRANSLSALLQTALETGFSEIDPEREPLKVL